MDSSSSPSSSSLATATNDTSSSTMFPMDDDEALTPTNKFRGHFIAGMFLLLFGGFFLGLILLRLHRLLHLVAERRQYEFRQLLKRKQRNSKNTKRFKEPMELSCFTIVALYCQYYLPERNKVLLRRVSIALMSTSLFGFLYSGLGAKYWDHENHPTYTFFHYRTHLTLTALFWFVGWTGFLESSTGCCCCCGSSSSSSAAAARATSSSKSAACLPRDSVRASVILALLGEAVLWMYHHSSNRNPVQVQLHFYLALLSLVSALGFALSMMLQFGKSSAPSTTRSNSNSSAVLLQFVGNVVGYIGLVWQGIWFLTMAIHAISPTLQATTEDIAILFVVQGLGLGIIGQCVTCAIYRKLQWVQQEGPSRRISDYYDMERKSSGSSGGSDNYDDEEEFSPLRWEQDEDDVERSQISIDDDDDEDYELQLHFEGTASNNGNASKRINDKPRKGTHSSDEDSSIQLV